MDANEFIDALGGNAAVASIAGVGSSAVSNWRKWGRLPPRLYLRFADAADEHGVEVPKELFREAHDERAA